MRIRSCTTFPYNVLNSVTKLSQYILSIALNYSPSLVTHSQATWQPQSRPNIVLQNYRSNYTTYSSNMVGRGKKCDCDTVE